MLPLCFDCHGPSAHMDLDSQIYIFHQAKSNYAVSLTEFEILQSRSKCVGFSMTTLEASYWSSHYNSAACVTNHGDFTSSIHMYCLVSMGYLDGVPEHQLKEHGDQTILAWALSLFIKRKSSVWNSWHFMVRVVRLPKEADIRANIMFWNMLWKENISTNQSKLIKDCTKIVMIICICTFRLSFILF